MPVLATQFCSRVLAVRAPITKASILFKKKNKKNNFYHFNSKMHYNSVVVDGERNDMIDFCDAVPLLFESA